MKTASTGRPASNDNVVISPDDFRRRPMLRFFMRLMTGTITAFVLATLTLFSLQAGIEHFETKAQTAVPAEQRHSALLPLAEKLAAVCWAGAGTVQLDSPVKRCVELTAKIARHLRDVPSSLTAQMAARLNTAAARWLQSATSRLAPAWRGNTRHAFAS